MSGTLDTGMYESYVRYKIRPLLQGQNEAIYQIASDVIAGQVQPNKLRDSIIAYGRACAMSSALSVGISIMDCLTDSETDISYADSLLICYYMILNYDDLSPDARSYLANNFKHKFHRDVDYLILYPDQEIRHVSQTGWRVLSELPPESEYDDIHGFYYNILGKISLARVAGHKHPYSALYKLKSISSQKQNDLYEALEADKLSGLVHLSHWFVMMSKIRRDLDKAKISIWS